MTTNTSRHGLLVAIASICHEANRRYCDAVMNDSSQPEWHEAPDWQAQSAITGVEAIADGTITRPEQSHESWLAEKAAAGWKYGPVKNPEAKEHPCFVPYKDLPELQRHKDALFFAIASTLLYAFGLKAPAKASPLEEEPILRYFAYAHLPPILQSVSRPFSELAGEIMNRPRSAERTVALRKLLESKDAAVRASIPAA